MIKEKILSLPLEGRSNNRVTLFESMSMIRGGLGVPGRTDRLALARLDGMLYSLLPEGEGDITDFRLLKVYENGPKSVKNKRDYWKKILKGYGGRGLGNID
jgi:hypothetical protein